LRVIEHELGKPDEQTELQQTLDPKSMTSEQRKQAIAAMVTAHPGLAALIPRAPAVHAEP
jgi:hypothetical protein